MSETDFGHLESILDSIPDLKFICLDVANGYSEHFVAFVKKASTRHQRLRGDMTKLNGDDTGALGQRTISSVRPKLRVATGAQILAIRLIHHGRTWEPHTFAGLLIIRVLSSKFISYLVLILSLDARSIPESYYRRWKRGHVRNDGRAHSCW